MSSDRMRDEFEAAMVAELNSEDPEDPCTVEEMRANRKGDMYSSHINCGAWWAWQASRAALVIELPPARNSSCAFFTDECFDPDELIRSIEAVGIKVKP